MKYMVTGCFLLLVTVAHAADAPAPIAFTDVTVVDVETGKLIPERAVVVTGTKITAVVPARGYRPPEGATAVVAAGKYLIPGLWDMHVHHEFPWPGLLDLAVANGVTGVRDMNGEPFVLDWRNEIRTGKRLGPRIVASGKYLDAKLNGQPPNRVSADTAEQAREMVRARKKAETDFIKVYSGLSPEVYRAVLDEAKEQGLTVAGHCPERVSALDASRLGQRSMEHTDGIALSCSRMEADLRKRLNGAFDGSNGYDLDLLYRVATDAMETQDNGKRTELFKAFKRNRTWQTPTLVTLRPLPAKGSPDTRVKYMHRGVIQFWDRNEATAPQETLRKTRTAFARSAVREMHGAGVPILAGTDAGGSFNARVFPGFSLADELELLVECGLTTADALRTATRNPAEYLGEQKAAGTVAVGMRADLVLLDADPLAAIGNVRKIAGVMVNGRWLPRPELDKLLAGVVDSTGNKK